jgi:hypothetical protein
VGQAKSYEWVYTALFVEQKQHENLNFNKKRAA